MTTATGTTAGMAAGGKYVMGDDYGDEDPFRVYDEGFIGYLRQSSADLSAHSWDRGHDGAYWSRHWPAHLRFYANSLANC
ncbi:MAG TPA: hypothetical protein VN732_00675 [Solirubrobacterales bacterium]|nr:hypothetical protein [Solirubrobacterales bacterium]